MLHSLTVSNIVLIEQLTLTFEDGLTVLTGETGAGKSILLDRLTRLAAVPISASSVKAQSQPRSATFHPPASPVWQRLADSDITPEDQLILRRRLKADGKSSASINDVPVSAALLRDVGDMLVEIQGQFEGRGLMDVATHIGLLDRAADHDDVLENCTQAGKLASGAAQPAHAKRELEKARRRRMAS